MNHEHVGDDAALYALGALSDREAIALQVHIRQCPSCANLVGDAEDAVTAAALAEPLHRAPAALERRITGLLAPQAAFGRGSAVAAIAAAFLLGILPSWYLWQQNRSMQDAVASRGAAMARIAEGPHRRASFRGGGGNVAADVMYAPDGSWYVIVVKGISNPLQVAWMHGGERTMLGSATPHGGLAMLYLPKSHRMDQLALIDGGRIVGRAALHYD
jgi:hypothetical protein